MSHIYMNSYEKFIEIEKEYSDRFLQSHQIGESRFYEDSYKKINQIWKEIKLINSIYETIDDIIKSFDFEKNIRFLIMGDFLSSLCSNEVIDPAEIILKTTRNAYFSRINLRASINLTFNYDYEKYILIHQKLLIGLRLKNILLRNIIRTKEGDK